MEMRQTTLNSWRRPLQPIPGESGAGPEASNRPILATGASANLQIRGRQSRATDLPDTDLTVVQWNAEGIKDKKPELQEFLRKNNVDVICVQETHLTEKQIKFFVRGYELFRHDRAGHKGGILTLVKNHIPAVEICKSEGEELEHQTIKLMLPSGNLMITNCYSPSTSKLSLHKVKVEETRHLVTGDFNSHSPSWGYDEMDKRGEEVEDWMVENKLILINHPDDKPSFYHRGWKTNTSPDLAMATDDLHRVTSREVGAPLGTSDHRPITLKITSAGCRNACNMRPSWNLKKANLPMFENLTDELTEGINSSNDLNHNMNKFDNAVIEAAKRSIPRGKRRNYKPYWSDTLENLHNKMCEAREEMEKHPETTQRHNSIRDEYNKEKNEGIRRNWHERTSNLNMEDSSSMWKLTNSLNEDVGERFSRTVIEEEGKHHAGKEAANIIVDFYKEASSNNIPNAQGKEVRKEINAKLKKENPSSLMMNDFTMSDLQAAIKKLKKKKAPGKDGILNDMIKSLGNSAKEKLLIIINQSWHEGKLPEKWREATIIPIRKKGKEKTKKSSYRPISLLSCIGKVMERMVNARLLKHLEENNLLTNTQSAYRKNLSTEDQLVYLTQQIENAFQDKKKVLAIFIDLTKAFDKVWREGLLLKLLNKKVEGKMFRWIQDFLQRRTARVKLDGKVSHRVTLEQGVPQGGVISPTLFLVFIDDIAEKLSIHISRALHADDLALWNASDHLSTATHRMQDAINKIEEWATEWGVEINTTKTVTTVFSLSPQPEVAKIQMKGRDLKQEDTPTYLGVKLDKRLTWNPHLKDVQANTTRKLSIMKKLAGTTWGANSKILKRVYTGTVRPSLEYGNTAWATAAKSNTSRLDKVQNAGLRLITGGMKTTPIHKMQTLSNLQPLEHRRKEKLCIHSEKLKRMPTHAMHKELQNLTKNRLERQSFNHLSRSLSKENDSLLPTDPEGMEILQQWEEQEEHLDKLSINMHIPGIENKNCQPQHVLRSLTLEMLDNCFPSSAWTQVYTDGSAEEAVKNGGAGILIKHTDGKCYPRALPTGKISSNFRAEATALLSAVHYFSRTVTPPPKIVFLTDCMSVLQSLDKLNPEKLILDIKHALCDLTNRSSIALQWIPAHCGISGNEEADKLSKRGSKMDQFCHPVSYREAKTIIKNKYNTGNDFDETDAIHQLERHEQVIIFRLRTGHNRLLSHLHKLAVSHTDECPCGTGTQDADHILQLCPSLSALRAETWPVGANPQQKLWGSCIDLKLTASFIKKAEVSV